MISKRSKFVISLLFIALLFWSYVYAPYCQLCRIQPYAHHLFERLRALSYAPIWIPMLGIVGALIAGKRVEIFENPFPKENLLAGLIVFTLVGFIVSTIFYSFMNPANAFLDQQIVHKGMCLFINKTPDAYSGTVDISLKYTDQPTPVNSLMTRS